MEDKVTRKLEQKKREKQLLHDVEWLMKRVPELLPQEVRAPAFRTDEFGSAELDGETSRHVYMNIAPFRFRAKQVDGPPVASMSLNRYSYTVACRSL